MWKTHKIKHYTKVSVKTLKAIADATWYVSNQTLHNDLRIPSIRDDIQKIAIKFNHQTVIHQNRLVEQLYDNGHKTSYNPKHSTP